MNNYCACLLITLAAVGRMAAQSPTLVPPPEPPLVLAMPENMHVEITVQNSKDHEKPGATPSQALDGAEVRSIEIIKTGATREIVVTPRQGKVKEYWVLDGFIFTASPYGNRVDRDVYNSLLPAYLNPGSRDIYGMEGVTLDRYKGLASYNGKPCYYYESGTLSKPEGQPKEPRPVEVGMLAPFAGGKQVWIDVKSKLPVAAVLPEGLCIYTFHPFPTVPLEPPSDFVKFSEQMKAMTARMEKEAAIR